MWKRRGGREPTGWQGRESGPTLDTDGDTIPDYLHDDSDGDGVSDADEAANPFLENNQAGKVRTDPCAVVADSDGDGIPDLRDGDGGATTDALYESRFDVAGSTESGNLAEPESGSGGLVAPASVRKILGALQAAGGGDAPEELTQALWMAASGGHYAATLGGRWPAPAPSCVAPGELNLPCFRPGALPVFVLITDAPMHNGPVAGYDYNAATTGGTKSYADALDAITALGAKVVGESVNTGTPGVARADLVDLAEKTDSLWHDPLFDGHDYPLVTDQDTATGDVSSEVVRLIGLLAG